MYTNQARKTHLPLVRVVVELSVELPHGNGLGVQMKRLYFLVALTLHPKSLYFFERVSGGTSRDGFSPCAQNTFYREKINIMNTCNLANTFLLHRHRKNDRQPSGV